MKIPDEEIADQLLGAETDGDAQDSHAGQQGRDVHVQEFEDVDDDDDHHHDAHTLVSSEPMVSARWARRSWSRRPEGRLDPSEVRFLEEAGALGHSRVIRSDDEPGHNPERPIQCPASRRLTRNRFMAASAKMLSVDEATFMCRNAPHGIQLFAGPLIRRALNTLSTLNPIAVGWPDPHRDSRRNSFPVVWLARSRRRARLMKNREN